MQTEFRAIIQSEYGAPEKILKIAKRGDERDEDLGFSRYVNPNKYIQHNLQVGPGPTGVAALIKNMPPDASVNTIRVFEDGDYVFAHTQYNFFGPRIGFDIFRYEDSLIVEHWDNLQETATEPSPSGHTMIDGPTIASDLDSTV